MYLWLLRALAAACLLCTFWPVLRFHDVTYFDWLAPVTVVLGLAYTPAERGAPLSAYSLAIGGILLLLLAGIISVAPSGDSIQHLAKLIKLTVALSGILGLAYLLANRRLLSSTEALTLLCLSASANSMVCILQGRFGMFTHLIPAESGRIEAWSRMTGLTEHPIESGVASCFGIILAIGLGMQKRAWWIFFPLVLIGLVSLTESASLTAVFALGVAFLAAGIFARAYRTLIAGAAVAVAGLVVAFALNAHRLTDRLEQLSRSQGNYSTVRSREMQWASAIDGISPQTILFGNGYSELDLPFHMEIHNGVLASLFHFGLLGLAGQCLLIAFFTVPLGRPAPAYLRYMLLGIVVMFLFSYLTGPALSRRSLWVTPFVLGAYLTVSRQPDGRKRQLSVAPPDSAVLNPDR